MSKIKICGLTRPEDIEAVNAAMPDYIGFVFAESKRRISAESAAGLRKDLAQGIIPVGVFVDEKVETIAEIANGGTINIIQLHGNEDGEYIKKLRKLCEKPVIKAVKPPFETVRYEKKDEKPEYFLLDSGAGSGVCFNWDEIDVPTPFFLAGGISIDNIDAALQRVKPFAVDISSGAETDGVKDPEKIKKLVRSVRNG